jgi:hypothetical protein
MQTNPAHYPLPWSNTSLVPVTVGKQLQALGLPALAQEKWAALTDLQRFALLKLTREGHENKKLPLALKEFGLLPA